MKSQSKHVKITLVDNENIAIRDGMTFHFRKGKCLTIINVSFFWSKTLVKMTSV